MKKKRNQNAYCGNCPSEFLNMNKLAPGSLPHLDPLTPRTHWCGKHPEFFNNASRKVTPMNGTATCDNCGKEGQLEFSSMIGAWEGPQDWLYIDVPLDGSTRKKLDKPPHLVCSEQCRLQLQEKEG